MVPRPHGEGDDEVHTEVEEVVAIASQMEELTADAITDGVKVLQHRGSHMRQGSEGKPRCSRRRHGVLARRGGAEEGGGTMGNGAKDQRLSILYRECQSRA